MGSIGLQISKTKRYFTWDPRRVISFQVHGAGFRWSTATTLSLSLRNCERRRKKDGSDRRAQSAHTETVVSGCLVQLLGRIHPQRFVLLFWAVLAWVPGTQPNKERACRPILLWRHDCLIINLIQKLKKKKSTARQQAGHRRGQESGMGSTVMCAFVWTQVAKSELYSPSYSGIWNGFRYNFCLVEECAYSSFL
jgi:hypothetical protein